jgi:NADP-reducing hydrogenase subunit HndC
MVKLIVSYGTCGIASGAKEAIHALRQEIAARNLAEIEIKTTGCIGLCYAEPNIEVIMPELEPVIYGNVTPQLAKQIIVEHVIKRKILAEYVLPRPAADILNDEQALASNSKQLRIVLRNCGVIDPENIDDYLARQGYAALKKCLTAMKPEEIIKQLEISGLRGRGGAGFPTWQKWNFSRMADSKVKYVVCNADEGDPGAYMDRSALEGDPHSILEAMTIAGYTIGAKEGIIYIRAEYPLAISRLEIAMEQAKKRGFLGKNILGADFGFSVELRLGAGAFVCGEETALLASIEGQRGMPRPRPPFPAVKGLWQQPTLINNVETLANIPVVILKGGEWFAKIGTEQSKGTKVFALTGKISNPGLIEVPMGTTLRDIIFTIGGGIKNKRQFKAVQTGGPSGGVIPAQFLDTAIDYETLKELGSMMGSGGMIVMDEDDCMIDVAKFYLQFSVDESCGKCTPCRIGTKQILFILEKISAGEGEQQDIELLKQIGIVQKSASLCGLGMTAPNPALSTLNYFPEEYQEHINQKQCRAGKCKPLTAFVIIPEKCIKCGLCAKNCPVNCISGEVKQKVFSIDQDKCVKCGNCFKVCPVKAVTRGSKHD